jgi:hypothetical protein
MNQQEVVQLMLDTIEEDNRMFCKQAGLTEEQAEENIAKSRDSLKFMMSHIYGKLVEQGVISLKNIDN